MKNVYKILSILFITSLIIFTACEDRSDLTEPALPNTGTADFSSFVMIGNSLTAGLQNSSLYESSQKYSVGALIAKQVGATFVQPLISDPGIPNRLEIGALDSNSPNFIKVNPQLGSLTNATYEKSYNNLGVPGAFLPDVLMATSAATSISKTNVMFDLILRGKGTQIAQAAGLQPTFTILWIGNNDILGHAAYGGTLPYTDAPTFQYLYTQAAGALKQTNTNAICVSIPYITSAPLFTTLGRKVGPVLQGVMTQNPAVLGLFYQKHGETIASGLASPDNLNTLAIMMPLTASTYASLIGQPTGKYYTDNGITPPAGIDINQPFGLHPQNPWPDALVLDADELSNIKTVIDSYNTAISGIASANGFKIYDFNSMLNSAALNGLTSDGVHFTTDFLTGGLFSLDGIHPTSQGYAVIANQIIDVINSNFGASIPKINVATIPGSLVLSKVSLDKNGIPVFPKGAFDNLLF